MSVRLDGTCQVEERAVNSIGSIRSMAVLGHLAQRHTVALQVIALRVISKRAAIMQVRL